MNGITRSSCQTRSGRSGRSTCVAGWIKVVSSLRSTKEASNFPQRCASATTLPAYRRLLSVLMLACMAALVSAACDLRSHTIYGVQDHGVTHVGVSADGTVYANGRWPTMNPGEQRYLSHDGGLSWVKGWDDSAVIKWTPGVANTPQGQYRITRSGVALQIDDQKWERVYSTEYLRKPGNHWVQEKPVGEVVNWPRDIIFEPLSGNLIVAMGQQGVAVGTPDGSWTRYGVGEYTPSDFSFTYKNQLLFSDVDFWVAALALSLSLTGAALVFSYHNPEASSLFAFTRCLISSAAAVISVALLLLFGDSIASDVPESFDRLTLPVFILGGLALVSSLLPPRYWLAGIVPFGGMVALIVLLFMFWLHAAIALGTAMFLAIALTLLMAFVLGYYLQLARYKRLSVSPYTNRWLKRFARRRTSRSGLVLCRHCQRPNNPLVVDCHTCGLPIRHNIETS